MRKLALTLALLLAAAPAFSQTPYLTGVGPMDTNPQPMKLLCWDGSSQYVPCSFGSSTPTGAAGSPNTAVQTVQGISGGTPIGSNLYNGSTAATWNTTNADGLAASSSASFLGANAFNRVFNGTSWDRARGDTTGGAWVQEKERSSFFAETSTPLAASASYPGTTRDAGASPSQWATFSCFANANQASAANSFTLQQSPDGTSWSIMLSTSLAANTPLILTSKVFFRYSRCTLANGTTAQTYISMASQFGSN